MSCLLVFGLDTLETSDRSTCISSSWVRSVRFRPKDFTKRSPATAPKESGVRTHTPGSLEVSLGREGMSKRSCALSEVFGFGHNIIYTDIVALSKQLLTFVFLSIGHFVCNASTNAFDKMESTALASPSAPLRNTAEEATSHVSRVADLSPGIQEVKQHLEHRKHNDEQEASTG